MQSKRCTRCNKTKRLTVEYFYKRKDSADGFRGRCKECDLECRSIYREENRQAINKDKLENYYKNRVEVLQKRKDYYKNNRESRLLYARNNAERQRQNNKIWRRKNKEHLIEYEREYRKRNPERVITKNQKRRARVKNVNNTLTVVGWKKIKAYFNNSCAYCGVTEKEHKLKYGEQLHQEHFVSLTSGGGYTHNNIIPSCKSCNSSKGTKDFFEWYPTHSSYNKNRETNILKYLGYDDKTQQLTLF